MGSNNSRGCHSSFASSFLLVLVFSQHFLGLKIIYRLNRCMKASVLAALLGMAGIGSARVSGRLSVRRRRCRDSRRLERRIRRRRRSPSLQDIGIEIPRDRPSSRRTAAAADWTMAGGSEVARTRPRPAAASAVAAGTVVVVVAVVEGREPAVTPTDYNCSDRLLKSAANTAAAATTTVSSERRRREGMAGSFRSGALACCWAGSGNSRHFPSPKSAGAAAGGRFWSSPFYYADFETILGTMGIFHLNVWQNFYM